MVYTPRFDGLHTGHGKSASDFNNVPTIIHNVTPI
jgi:hypothetical protein